VWCQVYNPQFENENVSRFSGVPLTEHQPEKLSSKVNILGGHFGVVAAPHPSGTGIPMEYKGVEYSVVQLTDDTGWRWEVRFGDGKNKSGVTPVSRAFAIKLAEYEIDRTLERDEVSLIRWGISKSGRL
jgi:hypothetical protein